MKIGPFDDGGHLNRPTNENKKQGQDRPVEQKPERNSDSVQISISAHELANKAELMRQTDKSISRPEPAEIPEQLSEYTDEARAAEIRADKVEQAKEKIESGHYDSTRVKEEIARRITDDLLDQ